MPDFQQFADRIKAALECAQLHADGMVDMNLDINAELLQAERHARLLQQIWEWTETHHNDEFPIDAAKAHVRSLLVGQQKAK